MGLVAGYDNDVFVSYSHIDNQPFGDPPSGWVDTFHAQLENFVRVRVGKPVEVWRDKRLTGAEVFSDEIEQQLRKSAVLVSIVSPGYLQSQWCNRELLAFTSAARDRGNLHVGNLTRVFKVVRLPVDRSALSSLLDEVLGTDFFRVDAASKRARDLLLDPDAAASKMFSARVDDVAQDVSTVLKALSLGQDAGAVAAPSSAAGTVFLAWTSADLSEDRERLRRELVARNYRVLPDGTPPLDAAALRQSVSEGLREAKVAVHLVGNHYGFVPEGEQRSVIELQCDDSIYQSSHSAAARVFWLAPSASAEDSRVVALRDALQRQLPSAARVDMLTKQTIEDLKTLVLDRLNTTSKPAARVKTASACVYLMCDQLDRESVAPIQDFLFDQSLEVRLPLFDGDADQIRAEHYETLKECDGVLIFWGSAKEGWLRTMLRDLNKVFGLGRPADYKAKSLYVADHDPTKASFRTHEVSIIQPNGGFDPDALRPFIAQLSSA